MAIAESIALRLPGIEQVAVAAVDRFEECPTCGGCYDAGTGRCPTDGAALVSTAAPRLLADRYQLERRLGRGGMGRCTSRSTHHSIAVSRPSSCARISLDSLEQPSGFSAKRASRPPSPTLTWSPCTISASLAPTPFW